MDNKKQLLWLILSLAVVACGGGVDGKGEDRVKTGKFVDSAVQGLNYVCGDLTGITDRDGRFQYREECQVQFRVGEIVIGTTPGALVVTPVELVSAAKDQNDPTVVNIARFLQTLDDDGNPSNGITITAAVAALANGSVNFSQSIADFEDDGRIQTLVSTLTSARTIGASGLMPISDVQDHLRTTLLLFYAGDYAGDFSGDDAGTWRFSVDVSGNIQGVIYYSRPLHNKSPFYVSGTLDSSGAASLSGSAGEVTFSGNFSRSGRISGTWNGATDAESGRFSGSRETPSQRIDLPVGTLAISGNDTAKIGDRVSFPVGSTNPVGGVFSVNFSYLSQTMPLRVINLDVGVNRDTNEPFIIQFKVINYIPPQLYVYQMDCTNGYCPGMTIDTDTQRIIFSNVGVAAGKDAGNDLTAATAAITLNGVLAWE